MKLSALNKHASFYMFYHILIRSTDLHFSPQKKKRALETLQKQKINAVYLVQIRNMEMWETETCNLTEKRGNGTET